MVDSVAPRPVSSEAKVQRVSLARSVANAPSANAPPATGPETRPQTDTAALSGVAEAMASSPPVDVDRVARVKRAIERGDFPILPATIADRMIAIKYDWMSADDQA